MPDIDNTIYKPYRDEGVLVYGLYGNETPDAIGDFVEQTSLSFPVVQDEGTRGALAYPAGVGYPYPRDAVIGKDLTIRSIRNSFNTEKMETLVQELLAE